MGVSTYDILNEFMIPMYIGCIDGAKWDMGHFATVNQDELLAIPWHIGVAQGTNEVGLPVDALSEDQARFEYRLEGSSSPN